MKPEYWICYVPSSGQGILLGNEAKSFFDRVEFDKCEGYISRIYPEGKDKLIVIDPEVKFGTPTFKGIPIEAMFSQYKSGEPVEIIASYFSISVDETIRILNFANDNLNIAA